jgi:distribution and morphology protein 34
MYALHDAPRLPLCSHRSPLFQRRCRPSLSKAHVLEERVLLEIQVSMSFSFEWPRFSEQFHHDAIAMLNTALNKGNKPPVIADRIEVVELEMGTQVSLSQLPNSLLLTYCQPPELEIRDIGDLTTDQFRGIFRFTYTGDAHLVLKTKVQVRVPVSHMQSL